MTENRQIISDEQLSKVCGGSSGSMSTNNSGVCKLVNDVSVNYVYWLDSHPNATYNQKREKVSSYMNCLYLGYDTESIEEINWFRTTYPNDWENLIDWITDLGFQNGY